MKSVQNMLEELGLSPNEVKVYLAGLEMGAATAQQLAAKAAVVRPTAYVAIGGLVKHGLMSSFAKGKKQFFAAEKPNRLTHLLNEEKKKLADRESKLKSVMPILDSLIAMSGEKPEVKLYEGLEGLEAMRNVLLESGAKKVDILVCQESYNKHVPGEASGGYVYKISKLKIKRRQIAILSSANKDWKPFAPDKNLAVKRLVKEKFDHHGEITIFCDYVALISYGATTFGALVKSQSISEVAGLMFEALWKSAK